ncbi:unnamed protein product [Sphenostylis stenocarpa]|uniref:Uncharacterized protein n=1 Tax=Sphenostylis stenocarpa TaxID=92480 RepID=A0AA86VIQ1_9FABA|nr:unnamed protein product [Sphenostylis stenocarpa]
MNTAENATLHDISIHERFFALLIPDRHCSPSLATALLVLAVVASLIVLVVALLALVVTVLALVVCVIAGRLVRVLIWGSYDKFVGVMPLI